MVMDFLKKGINGLGQKRGAQDGAKAPDKKGGKSDLKGMSFDEGEASLAPDENKKGETPKAKKGPVDNRNIFEKADDALGIGQRFRTDAWTKRQWKVAHEKLASFTPDDWLRELRGPLLAFAQSEFSAENVHGYEAVKRAMAGEMTKQAFFEKYLRPGADEELNTPFGPAYAKLAAQGEYDKMDLDAVQRAINGNLSDTLARARFDPTSLKLMFTRITNMTPPDVVGEGYKD